MKSNEDKYYYMNDILMAAYPGCCGIEIANNFFLEKQHYPGGGHVGTIPQVYKHALQQISKKRRCKHIQLSIVTKYKNTGKEQLPGFKDFLLKNKWNLIDEFVNPNHGNTVAVLSKTFPKKKQPKSNRINYW